MSEHQVSLQMLATAFERDEVVVTSLEDLAEEASVSGKMLSHREEEDASSVRSGASRAGALGATLAEPLFLTVAKGAVGKIDDT